MARTRTTIRRVDPWSILKFGFVANLVLLGIQLLAGTVIWYVIQRLELIETVCELAATVGFEECGVDGGALFDTVLVLGLLGVVIQTGILVFLTFLANLIFDLTGGIVVTLEDDRSPATGGRTRAGVGSRSSGAASFSGASTGGASAGAGSSRDGSGGSSRSRTSASSASSASSSGDGSSSSDTTRSTPVPQGDGAPTAAGRGSDDDTLFGGS